MKKALQTLLMLTLLSSGIYGQENDSIPPMGQEAESGEAAAPVSNYYKWVKETIETVEKNTPNGIGATREVSHIIALISLRYVDNPAFHVDAWESIFNWTYRYRVKKHLKETDSTYYIEFKKEVKKDTSNKNIKTPKEMVVEQMDMTNCVKRFTNSQSTTDNEMLKIHATRGLFEDINGRKTDAKARVKGSYRIANGLLSDIEDSRLDELSAKQYCDLGQALHTLQDITSQKGVI